MAKRKSTARRLADLIAKREGIKPASALRRIQRAAKAGKSISGVTRRQKQLFAEYQAERNFRNRAKLAPQGKVTAPARGFDFGGTRLLKIFGRVRSGSGSSKDIRERTISWPVTSDQANDIFNSGDPAAEVENIVPYVDRIFEWSWIQFDGREYGPGNF